MQRKKADFSIRETTKKNTTTKSSAIYIKLYEKKVNFLMAAQLPVSLYIHVKKILTKQTSMFTKR